VAEKELLGSPIWVFQDHHVIAIKEFGPHVEESRVSVVVGELLGLNREARLLRCLGKNRKTLISHHFQV